MQDKKAHTLVLLIIQVHNNHKQGLDVPQNVVLLTGSQMASVVVVATLYCASVEGAKPCSTRQGASQSIYNAHQPQLYCWGRRGYKG